MEALIATLTAQLEEGKPKKVVRCAAIRKLLHVTWAVVT
jgi:hypothetical protein